MPSICGFWKEMSTFLRRKRCKASGTNAACFNSSHKIPWPRLDREGQTVLGKTDSRQGKIKGQRQGGRANEARVQAPTATWWSPWTGKWMGLAGVLSWHKPRGRKTAGPGSKHSFTHSFIHLSIHSFLHSFYKGVL